MKTIIILVFVAILFTSESKGQSRELPCVNILNIVEVYENIALIEWDAVNIPDLIGYEIKISDAFFNEIFSETTSNTKYEWESIQPSGTFHVQIRLVVMILGIKIVGPFCSAIAFSI